uniref:Uncharacterized protein n=1 Tax=Leersia perrieri TaxID=77586 RepID=A0A0D9X9J5_9ORYZ
MPAISAAAAAAGAMLHARIRAASLRVRGGAGGGGRWTTPGHEERPKGYLFNRPAAAGESRGWEDWELP